MEKNILYASGKEPIEAIIKLVTKAGYVLDEKKTNLRTLMDYYDKQVKTYDVVMEKDNRVFKTICACTWWRSHASLKRPEGAHVWRCTLYLIDMKEIEKEVK
ncbi:MAG: hypothetical protein QXW75_00560 [Thermoplasmatales archaeon]